MLIQHEASQLGPVLSRLIESRPHLECHKSHKGLLTNFKWFIVNGAGGQLAFNLPFSDCIICKPYLVDSILHHL